MWWHSRCGLLGLLDGRSLRLWWCWCGLRLWPSRAAIAFWGTTIRNTRNEVKFGLDSQDLMETSGQEFFAPAHLHGGASAIIIEPDCQQLAVISFDLSVAVDGHPNQTGFVFEKFQHLGPCAAHHLHLGRLLCGLLWSWLLGGRLLRWFGHGLGSLRSLCRWCGRLLGDRLLLLLLWLLRRWLCSLTWFWLRCRWRRSRWPFGCSRRLLWLRLFLR